MISDMLETAHLFGNQPNEVYDNHEDAKLFQGKKGFQRSVTKFGKSILEQESQLVHTILKKLLDQKAIESVKCAKYIENHQGNCLLESV